MSGPSSATSLHSPQVSWPGTAIETSIDATLSITILKADSLPAPVQNLQFLLLENDNEHVLHGFTYPVGASPTCQPECAVGASSLPRGVHDLDVVWHCTLAAVCKLNLISMVCCAVLFVPDNWALSVAKPMSLLPSQKEWISRSSFSSRQSAQYLLGMQMVIVRCLWICCDRRPVLLMFMN